MLPLITSKVNHNPLSHDVNDAAFLHDVVVLLLGARLKESEIFGGNSDIIIELERTLLRVRVRSRAEHRIQPAERPHDYARVSK